LVSAACSHPSLSSKATSLIGLFFVTVTPSGRRRYVTDIQLVEQREGE